MPAMISDRDKLTERPQARDVVHEGERNVVETALQIEKIVFERLNMGVRHVENLIAYAMFKLDFLDFVADFRRVKGRAPLSSETEAYLLGETTERRLIARRYLAADVLESAGRSSTREDAAVTKQLLAVWLYTLALGAVLCAIAYYRLKSVQFLFPILVLCAVAGIIGTVAVFQRGDRQG